MRTFRELLNLELELELARLVIVFAHAHDRCLMITRTAPVLVKISTHRHGCPDIVCAQVFSQNIYMLVTGPLAATRSACAAGLSFSFGLAAASFGLFGLPKNKNVLSSQA
jgi:hypothetical protein